jgi:hypothetical protein
MSLLVRIGAKKSLDGACCDCGSRRIKVDIEGMDKVRRSSWPGKGWRRMRCKYE